MSDSLRRRGQRARKAEERRLRAGHEGHMVSKDRGEADHKIVFLYPVPMYYNCPGGCVAASGGVVNGGLGCVVGAGGCSAGAACGVSGAGVCATGKGGGCEQVECVMEIHPYRVPSAQGSILHSNFGECQPQREALDVRGTRSWTWRLLE
ncbi:hypothetical protein K503DRAFT_785326 [Rhizopogon vinicolor AM-OR11-026]|uniref:Uncharacterized protein n=1 Tax=Rhizopogon vinicolor AM-OR11-026 TaxID=1314800 RepID=A0A1B7MR72_9AGAM|nr:hypothetical protein K503DRAFT_785326 [Rhizopogon vinicolor AM-OR11-026]